jgi:nitrite reductase/ring-hydroxylating ferredoxin subunit
MSRPIATGHRPGDLRAVRLLAAAELSEGTMRAVRVAGIEPIALYRVNDTVRATQDTCTHAQASLTEGELDGEQVWCPVHAAAFCLRTGAALRFPATEPLRVFPVWIDDGYICVDLRAARRCEDQQ